MELRRDLLFDFPDLAGVVREADFEVLVDLVEIKHLDSLDRHLVPYHLHSQQVDLSRFLNKHVLLVYVKTN